ncbi:MAG: DUF389 domain-containing protein [Pseudomonadales bacterium]|nr:DUF389 domain-containing protein [Pseudomonadales bacterium]
MLHKIAKNFSLAHEQDSPLAIHDNIVSGIVVRGTNLWILMIAIVIASVGLNINSTAVIIGAMLISPLMGPIIGIGYGLGTYDFDLVRQALKNFLFTVIVSLVVSTLYFSVSPLNEAHSELLARTSPNIYDVLIAFFGGLAGFIAIVSRQKGNVITGVAIATALMPPLCTAGYGIATNQWSFLIGALYLFTINTVFIALAALIATRLFGQPLILQADSTKKQIANSYVSAIVFLTLIPSVILGMSFISQDQFNRLAKRFVSGIKIENNYLLQYEITPSKRHISLVFGGIGLTNQQKEDLIQQLRLQSPAAELTIQQGFSFSQLGEINVETQLLRTELARLRDDMTALTTAKQQDTVSLAQNLLTEIQVFYPDVNSLSLAKTEHNSEDNAQEEIVLIVKVTKQPTTTNSTKLRNTLATWAKKRLENDNILVLINPDTSTTAQPTR